MTRAQLDDFLQIQKFFWKLDEILNYLRSFLMTILKL